MLLFPAALSKSSCHPHGFPLFFFSAAKRRSFRHDCGMIRKIEERIDRVKGLLWYPSRLKGGLAGGLWMLVSCAWASAFSPADIRPTTLSNGLRVVLKRGTPELASVALWVRAGSCVETEATSGASSLLERLLVAPTGGRGLAAAVGALGGTCTADTSRDWLHLTATVPPASLEALLKGWQVLLARPPLTAAALRREQTALLSQIDAYRTLPRFQIPRLLVAQLYARHPYRLPAIGQPASIRALSLTALRRFYEKWFVPANMSLVVVSALAPDRVEACLQRTLAQLPARPRPVLPRPQEPPLARSRQIQTTLAGGPGQNKGRTFGMAFRAPGVGGPDVYAMDVLMALLGEIPQARLRERLKEELKFAREVSCEFLTQRDPGFFLILLSLTPEADPAAARQALLTELQRVARQGVAPEECRQARQWIARTYRFDSETPAGQADVLGFYEAIDTFRFAVTYLDRIASVTPQRVQAVARRYLTAAYAAVLFEVQ